MSIAKEIIDGMERFADDLERGDLSGYRITESRLCPLCGEPFINEPAHHVHHDCAEREEFNAHRL